VVDKIRIGIVDVYPIFRDGVVRAIGRAKNLTVVAAGDTAEDARRLAWQCDVLLLEPAVPGSIDLAKEILENTSTKVVFLSARVDEEHAKDALHLGVHGYLVKEVTGTELVSALRAVHSGARHLPSDLAWRLLGPTEERSKPVLGPTEERRKPVQPLGIREQQVLDHTSKGLTNAQVADLLGLSVSTIKRYKTRLYRRIGVRNRLEALAKAGQSKKPVFS
jgi:two-component system, NarL family, nitrate/nitrite response regulator NarL